MGPTASSSAPPTSAAPPTSSVRAHTRRFGPLSARDPDLEVLLADGLGGFALGSLAGVPTRCYSGLVVSAQPPVQRRAHLVSPLERLSVAGRTTELHALEIAPGVYEGRGLECLVGAALHDLLPEREQQFAGTRVIRRAVSPAHAGALVLLYDVSSAEAATLTLGGYFVDRDMHHVHTQTPALSVEAGGAEATVRGEGTTRLTLHAPGAQVRTLTPAPFPQRVYYRHDEARGEPPYDRTLGAELWEVSLPPGGGRVALVVQGEAPGRPPVPDPWAAHAAEALRRRALAERAWAESGVRDGVVATLAVAADAYLVQRAQPAGLTVIAGYPWFADWGRDTMIALSGLTLSTGRHEDARALLETFLGTLRGGLTPNNFHEDGRGAGYNTVDGALWLAVALERYVDASGDLTFARAALPRLRELLDWHVRGTEHGIRADPQTGLLWAGQPGVQLTWMDVKIGDWVVTPRHGQPVEVQGLWLSALGAEGRLSARLGQDSAFGDWRRRAAAGFAAFWSPETGLPADVLAPDGARDEAVRPNAAIALALPDTPGTTGQRRAVAAQTARELLTPVGLHTLSPLDAAYRGNYGGPQLQRDAAYHQGTVWPWPLGSYVDLLLRQGEVAAARAALHGLSGHLWEAGLGHVSEVFSGDGLRPGGCPFQAWSVAELLRAHVAVSRAEAE